MLLDFAGVMINTKNVYVFCMVISQDMASETDLVVFDRSAVLTKGVVNLTKRRIGISINDIPIVYGEGTEENLDRLREDWEKLMSAMTLEALEI